MVPTDSVYAFIAMFFNAMLLHWAIANDVWCTFLNRYLKCHIMDVCT